MLSFTKPTSDQDGEAIDPAAAATPDGASSAADAASPEVSPLFAKREETPTPATVEAAYEPAVRSQIQRVRLDLLSRETERLELQLRQVLDQQNEDRQLREELRGQIASLNQRIEGLLAGDAAKPADSSSTDGDLRTAVKPLLQAVMEMLDSAEAVDSPGRPAPAAESSEAWAQVDAARRESAATLTSVAETPVEQAQEATPEPETETVDAADEDAVADASDALELDPPESDAEPIAAADPEEDLDPDPEAELRIEIARLLRPKKAGGGYEPLGSRAKPTIQRAETKLALPRAASAVEPDGAAVEPSGPSPMVEFAEAEPVTGSSSTTDAQGTNPEPLLLGTDKTPEIGDAPPAKSHAVEPRPAGTVDSGRASGQGDQLDSGAEARDDSTGGPKAEPAQGDLRGGGSVPKGQRPSWAPRPNPMRASLPKCLTEPWEEPIRRPATRWPFRRARPAGRRNDPTD